MATFKIWLLVGLGLSLIGGLLVSVEAIKLENLHRLVVLLRDRIEVTFESPLFAVDDSGEIIPFVLADDEVNVRRGFGQRTSFYVGAHLVAGAVLVAAVGAVVGGIVGADPAAVLFSWIWNFSVPAAVALTIVLSVVALGICYAAGELVIHGMISKSIRGVSSMLAVVEQTTPSGVVGIVGSAFLTAGFAAQVVGTVVS